MSVAVTATEAVSSVRTGDPKAIVCALSPASVRAGLPFPSGHKAWDAESPPHGATRPTSPRPSQSPWSRRVLVLAGLLRPKSREPWPAIRDERPAPQKGWVLPVEVADDLWSGNLPQVVRAEGVPRDDGLIDRPAGRRLESVQPRLDAFLQAGAPASNRDPDRSVLDTAQPGAPGGRADTVLEATSRTLTAGAAAKSVGDAPTAAGSLGAIRHARGAIAQLAVLSFGES
jgi:hypothetical protein